MHSNFTPFMGESYWIGDHFFSLLFPKDSKNLKSLDIGLWEVGAKNVSTEWTHCRGDFTPFMSKSFQIQDPFFSLLSPKDSQNLNFLDIILWEVGASIERKILHMTGYIQNMTHDGWWTLCNNFRSLALIVWDLWWTKIWRKRIAKSVN